MAVHCHYSHSHSHFHDLSPSSSSLPLASRLFRGRPSVSCIIPSPLQISRRLALLQLAQGSQLQKMTSLYSLSQVQMRGDRATIGKESSLKEWVERDNRRMLHAVYRVGNLDKTIKFYTECLGMKLLRKRDIPEEKYSNAFLGFGPEDTQFAIELTYNYGVDKYNVGTGFGHFGIAVEDVYKKIDLIKAKGGKVTREAGPTQGGSAVIAFVEDPDGYTFELIQRSPTPEPFCQIMLRVGDLDRSIKFYEKYTLAFLGYGPEENNTVLELTYNYGVTEYDHGDAYAQIAIGTDDVYKTAKAIQEITKEVGGKLILEPGPVPGINTKITACVDPDGWKLIEIYENYKSPLYGFHMVLVDNMDFLKELE